MTLVATDALDQDKLFKGLGPEPLSDAFDVKYLKAALDGKRTPIKSALLDQRVVVGLGNIYVSEALWRAGISPKRLAGSISGPRIVPLLRAIHAVLHDAIDGRRIKLARLCAWSDGNLGEFQHRFAVYDRAGDPCRKKTCKGTIKRIVQAGRSTFYCPICQK